MNRLARSVSLAALPAAGVFDRLRMRFCAQDGQTLAW
jgi:hypothetical protein